MEHGHTSVEAGTPDMEPGISVTEFGSPCMETGIPGMEPGPLGTEPVLLCVEIGHVDIRLLGMP